MNKKSLLALLNGKKAKKTYPAPHIEDRDSFIKNITMQLLGQGANEKDIEVDAQKISIGRQFWWLPKHSREGDIVEVQVRSKDIITTPVGGESCYGDIVGWQVSGCGEKLIHKVSGATLIAI